MNRRMISLCALHLDDIPTDLEALLRNYYIYSSVQGIFAIPEDGDGHHWQLSLLLDSKKLIPVVVSEEEFKKWDEIAFRLGTDIRGLIKRAVELYIQNIDLEDEIYEWEE